LILVKICLLGKVKYGFSQKWEFYKASQKVFCLK